MFPAPKHIRTRLTHGGRRALTLLLSAALLAPVCAAADEAQTKAPTAAETPTCDEAYYATMDYYGNITNGSVVKSYQMHGADSITDYGTYDDVINLTDSTQPTVEDGKLQFNFSDSEEKPSHFYFEGKTETPFAFMPWDLNLSYRLNGVDKKAEDLAGQSGLFEINVDATPNQNTSEYFRNNFTLEAVAAFNADDILSLEAPGAQVQLIGNLRVVLFMALPGEEQHFTIRVGSDDFKFSGMMFMMVPATLSQLDQIADLRKDKEKVEDSYDAINDSMDVILNTLDGMSSSLNTTANGLDELNNARSTISSGKGDVYDKADQALSDLGTMADALTPAVDHLAAASQTLTDVNDSLTALTQTAVGLKPELETTRSIIKKIQTDTANLRTLLTSVESYTKEGSNIASDLKDDLEDMSDDLDDLQCSLEKLENALTSVSGSSLSGVDDGDIVYNGMTLEQINDNLNTAKEIYAGAAQAYSVETPTEDQFITVAEGAGMSSTQAQELGDFYYAYLSDVGGIATQIDAANNLVGGVNDDVTSVNSLLGGITAPTATVVDDMRDLCITLGDPGVTCDLEDLSDLVSDLLKDVDDHKGEAAAFTEHLDELGDLATRVSQSTDTALDQLQTLDDTVNAYIPEAQQALTDAQTLTTSTNTTLQDSRNFLSALESLMKNSGGSLDTGTQQTLTGLAESLRKSTKGLEQTDVIRSSKNTIKNLIDDEWDSHTGEDNNVLLMDANASPVSLTSEQNASPSSVQVIIRTQEIKVEEEDQQEEEPASTDQGTFFSRVAQMFKDIWGAITGLFH
ncbi:MAG: hypothetical protein LKK00_02540 [Intestinimonas sp.]|jgi:putative membrane protein|nr:hypothetical protein [Intestinimonas sp.]